MPFDPYSGTLSQIVGRIVNDLTSLQNSPFTVVATWGTTYKWYALKYNDPDAVASNNMYLIIGSHTMRATVGTTPVSNHSTCSTTGSSFGRPYNFYGISFIITNQFDPSTFSIPSGASVLWTFAYTHLHYVQTITAVSATPCNDSNVSQTFNDMSATAYIHYDKYGFTIGIAGQPGYQPVQAFVVVRRLRPINLNVSIPHWWYIINDQRTFNLMLDTYSSGYPNNTPYPANLCGYYPWTTSGTSRGLCADNMSAYNMPSGIFTTFINSGIYPATFNSSVERAVRGCPFSPTNAAINRAPVSFYRIFTSSAYTNGTWGPYIYALFPSCRSKLDGVTYIARPIIGVGSKPGYTTYYGVVPDNVLAQLDSLIPIPGYADIADFDLIQLSTGEQYIAISLNAPTTPLNVATCPGDGGTGGISNVGIQRYFIRYN